MKLETIPQTCLLPETVLKAPYLLWAEDRAVRFDQGDALSQERPLQESCVVVRMGSVVRCHFGSGSIERVLRVEYGVST